MGCQHRHGEDAGARSDHASRKFRAEGVNFQWLTLKWDAPTGTPPPDGRLGDRARYRCPGIAYTGMKPETYSTPTRRDLGTLRLELGVGERLPLGSAGRSSIYRFEHIHPELLPPVETARSPSALTSSRLLRMVRGATPGAPAMNALTSRRGAGLGDACRITKQGHDRRGTRSSRFRVRANWSARTQGCRWS